MLKKYKSIDLIKLKKMYNCQRPATFACKRGRVGIFTILRTMIQLHLCNWHGYMAQIYTWRHLALQKKNRSLSPYKVEGHGVAKINRTDPCWVLFE